jgi:RHS repeat-associated protein
MTVAIVTVAAFHFFVEDSAAASVDLGSGMLSTQPDETCSALSVAQDINTVPGDWGPSFGRFYYSQQEYYEYYSSYFRQRIGIPRESRILAAFATMAGELWTSSNPIIAFFEGLVPDGKWNEYDGPYESQGFSAYNYPTATSLLDIPVEGEPVYWDLDEPWCDYTTCKEVYRGPDISNLVQTRIDAPDYDPSDPEKNYFGIGLHWAGGGDGLRHVMAFFTRVIIAYITYDHSAQAEEVDKFTGNIRFVTDPVDVITGNVKTFPEVDFRLSGTNEPLEFARTYNSQTKYYIWGYDCNGPLGYGWTHTYSVVLTAHEYAPTILVIMDGEGQFHHFEDTNDDDIFEPRNNDGTYVVRTEGAPDTYAWERKDGKKYHFDAIHKTVTSAGQQYYPMNDYLYYMTAIEYKDGSGIELSYEANPSTGNQVLAQITDTYNRTVVLSYDDSDRILTIDEPGRHAAGRLVEFSYPYLLTSVTYPVDTDTTYTHNYYYETNRVCIQDERGNSFCYEFDENKRCVLAYGEDDGQGAGPFFKTEMEYHPEAGYTIVKRTRGGEQFTDTYHYNGQYITQVDHSESGVTEKYSYDMVPGGISTLTKLTMDPSESPPYYLKKISKYNENFDLIETIEGIVAEEDDIPTSYPVEARYADANNPNLPTQLTDQRDVSTFLNWNNMGEMAQIYKNDPQNPLELTEFSYTDDLLDSITDPNEKVTGFEYYQNKELQSIDPPGSLAAVEYEYDGAGRVVMITQKDDQGNDRMTEIERDWLGRITQITYPAEGGSNLATIYDYDATDLYDQNASYGVNVIDTNGVKTQYLYNSGGLLWKVVRDRGEGQDDLNAVTTFEYDAYGNLISLTDPEGNTTTFEYDSLDRLVSITYPEVDENERVKSFTYYPDGSLASRTDPNGVLTEYTYNDDNRLWKTEYKPDGVNVAETIEFTYEPNGLITSVVKTVGLDTSEVIFAYDGINRLESSNGALSGDFDLVSYEYFNGGQRQSLTDLMGETEYTINDWNAIDDIVNPYSRTMSYSYNQHTGALARIAATANVYTNYDFDSLDRLDYYQLSNGNMYNYEYNDANLIDTISIPGNKSYEYVYDDMYRLTNEYALDNGSPIYTNNYEYDLADNRTGVANGVADIFTINALNQITEIYQIYGQPHTTFEYDLNGNLIEQTTSAGTVEMEYDYENRLVKITYPIIGSTEFVYDPLGRRLKTIEKNGQGQVLSETRYVYDGINLIAELDANDQLLAGFTHGPGVDDPLIARYNGSDYLYLKNHQGSVLGLATFGGSVVKTYKYDAFGNIKQETGPTVDHGFTYTSRERHARSGLYYYRARWYSPVLGRFLSQDPIGHLGGVNLYTYGVGDPANNVDPLGLIIGEMGPTLGYIWEGSDREIVIPGYCDLNVTVGSGGGITTGGMISQEGVYLYLGPAIVTGPGVSFTFAPLDNPTPGLNTGFQFGALEGFQIGRAEGDWFVEGGIMSPGATFSLYYVFGPFFNPKKCK